MDFPWMTQIADASDRLIAPPWGPLSVAHIATRAKIFALHSFAASWATTTSFSKIAASKAIPGMCATPL
jgi:hypothetical protein